MGTPFVLRWRATGTSAGGSEVGFDAMLPASRSTSLDLKR
jgi:hypothetical protein